MRQLYPYQQHVFDLLRDGKNVIIQAPTGAGKTFAAMYPYFHFQTLYDAQWQLHAIADDPLPMICRYAVPMRILATQFAQEHRDYFAKLERKRGNEFMKRYHAALELPLPALQTGEVPEDPKFESPLTFCTIDQLLASFIGTPYSLSKGQANLNVGAIIGSYLILDEFHLYPYAKNGDGALLTTIAMLQMAQPFCPFVLMTATFSSTLLAELASLLNAKVVRITDEEELATIMRGRQRSINHLKVTDYLERKACLVKTWRKTA